MVFLLWSSLAFSAPLSFFVPVFERWEGRALNELRIEGVPAPYRTEFSVWDYESAHAMARFGALVNATSDRDRPARAEVVVGDPSLDSARFVRSSRARRQALQVMNFVDTNAEVAIDRDLWVATDAAFKAGITQLQAKAASRAAQGGASPPPDWSEASAIQSVKPGESEPISRAALEVRVQGASAVFEQWPELEQGEVRATAVNGDYTLVSSNGTRLVQEEGYAAVWMGVSLRRSDGVVVRDERQWVGRQVGDLPDLAALKAAAQSLGESVMARKDAAVVDYYEGPVLFEGEAAADLFRALLPPQLEGTPPSPRADRGWREQQRGAPRLGRGVLPSGWTVSDDPGAGSASQAGGFAYDREGVAAQSLRLVDDGRVVDLAMSRVPRADLSHSNGHARGTMKRPWQARLSVWRVQPARDLSARRFERSVRVTQRASGEEELLVIRRLSRSTPGGLSRPTDAVWRASDGSERPVLSMMFQGVDRRTLRDLVAASGQQTRPYLAGWSAGERGGADTGLATVLIAPDRVLVDGLELVFPGSSTPPYAYGAP